VTGFERALVRTGAEEGRYSNDPGDPGGETYRGVSRNRWPELSLWSIVDRAKRRADFPECLDADPVLRELVDEFYLARFWRPLRCSELPEEIALELYDSGVNVGTSIAPWLLQGGLHAAGEEITVDGNLGPATLAAATRRAADPTFARLWRAVQAGYYLCLGLKVNLNLKRNFAGWLARARR